MPSVKPQEAGERGDEEEELRRRVAKRQRDYCTESQGPTATMPPPLKVQVTCFQMKGSMAPRQTDRQTDSGARETEIQIKKKNNQRISLDRASKRDNEGMTKLLPEEKGEGTLDLKVRQKDDNNMNIKYRKLLRIF